MTKFLVYFQTGEIIEFHGTYTHLRKILKYSSCESGLYVIAVNNTPVKIAGIWDSNYGLTSIDYLAQFIYYTSQLINA